jgi:tight adherence protein B
VRIIRQAIDRARLRYLLEGDPWLFRDNTLPEPSANREFSANPVRILLRQAGLPESVTLFGIATFLSGLLLSLSLHQLLSLWLLPATLAVGLSIPWLYVIAKAEKRALEFAQDFPTVLLATASSLSAGNTALVAIERSVSLLPENNPVRLEVERMLQALQSGEDRRKSICSFGRDIRLAELELFKTAFALSLESGGKFSPTLQRLAQVLRDRLTLIRTAKAVTAVMRMTANVLLVITPVVVGLIAARTENFSQIIYTHPVANTVASIGFTLIAFNYFILRRMSNFSP